MYIKMLNIMASNPHESDYIQVVGLKNVNSAYIDPDYYPQTGDVILHETTIRANGVAMQGIRNYQQYSFRVGNSSSGNVFACDYADGMHYGNITPTAFGTRAIYKTNTSGASRIIVETGNESQISTWNAANVTSIYPYLLFASYDNYFSSPLQIKNGIENYSFKVIRGGEVIIDMFCCLRGSDNEIGMFDRVRNRFFGNSGNGYFEILTQ